VQITKILKNESISNFHGETHNECGKGKKKSKCMKREREMRKKESQKSNET
jgi:hypothetical protein